MKRIIPLLVALLCSSSFVAPAGGKFAHKQHYKGTLYFIDGKYAKALSHFQRAYNKAPDNFNFALSLGLGLGRTGKGKQGIKVLQGAQPDKQDPAYRQKLALKDFFAGMVHAYAGQFHQAIPLYRKSIQAQRELDEPEILSVMHNALGHAIVVNRGRHAYHRGGRAPHYHVHVRDFRNALPHFEAALEHDPNNPVARHNYQLLCDSLGIVPKVFDKADAASRSSASTGNTYSNLPGNVSAALTLTEYDEIILLLDISGSMVMENVICKGATRFDVMKETLLLLLDEIDSQTRIGLGTIGGDCGRPPKLWFSAGQLDKEELRAKLRFLTPDGTTPLLSTLHASTDLFTTGNQAARSIFLVSDGEDVCRAPGVEICSWAKNLAKRDIVINILTFLEANFSNTNAFAEYTCLSDNTYGRILYIDNYRCRMERYEFSLMETCHFYLPPIRRADCLGPTVKDLWAIDK
jgi:tetratricopeptide (TPR) repeat protein